MLGAFTLCRLPCYFIYAIKLYSLHQYTQIVHRRVIERKSPCLQRHSNYISVITFSRTTLSPTFIHLADSYFFHMAQLWGPLLQEARLPLPQVRVRHPSHTSRPAGASNEGITLLCSGVGPLSRLCPCATGHTATCLTYAKGSELFLKRE